MGRSKRRVLRFAAPAALGAAGVYAFVRRRRTPRPFPASSAWVLDNPISRAQARTVLEHIAISPGMRVLDVGCGSGRLTIPIAEMVGPLGEVVGLDIQAEMIEKLEKAVAERGLVNVNTVIAGAGDGVLDSNEFDLAVVSSVLGEVAAERRRPALEEIYGALKPGGRLWVVETLVDPDYQKPRAVKETAESVGFKMREYRRVLISYSMGFEKPEKSS